MSSFGPVGRWRRWPAGAREDVRNEIIRRSLVTVAAVLAVLVGMPAAAHARAMPASRIDGGAGMKVVFKTEGMLELCLTSRGWIPSAPVAGFTVTDGVVSILNTPIPV